MFATFETAQLGHCQTTPKFNGTAVEGLPREGFDKAQKEISAWDAYEATPLLSLSGLAERLKLGDIRYKHEASRFGLGSFKALGGAYAVLHVLQRELSKALGVPVALEDVRNGKHAALVKELTVISATDGNHGRSVAWGASRFGANCRIYIHAEVSEHRAEVMRGLGAEVIRIEGDYDDTVARTRLDAEEHGWLIVSDTSWPGYRLPPLDVMAGYGVMAQEIVNQYTSPPTHVFLQGGVGGLAAAVAAVFCQVWGTAAPRVIIVEPELAPCLFASAKAGSPTAVAIHEETIMAGLSCGEPSELAWSVLADCASDFITIPESTVAPTVRMLATGAAGDMPFEAGESGVAGLAGLISMAMQPELRDRVGLSEASSIVLIGSEGVTDPGVFSRIMANEV